MGFYEFAAAASEEVAYKLSSDVEEAIRMTWASEVLRYMESRQYLDGRTQKHKLL